MSVDYRYYLIPTPNSFLPELDQIFLFLREAQAGRWFRPHYPGWIARQVQGRRISREAIMLENVVAEILKCWNVGISIGWRLWRRDEEVPYDLEIHVSPSEYVYQVSETVNLVWRFSEMRSMRDAAGS